MRDRGWVAATALVLIGATLMLGCQRNAALLRLTTYPPDFRYISDDEIESVMWRLAGRVHELERVAATDEPEVETLLAILDRIEAEAHTLESTGGGSNHPYLQAKLRTFLSKVQRSQVGLRSDPPRVTTVDEVWRACSGCHERS